eukprot:1119872-Pleurochrysis_carterae.AAC.2
MTNLPISNISNKKHHQHTRKDGIGGSGADGALKYNKCLPLGRFVAQKDECLNDVNSAALIQL